MSSHHPLGKREEILFVRLHKDEAARLARLAVTHGLSRTDYSRKRLLEEPLPPLPAVIPAINVQAISRLRSLRKRIDNLHAYCGVPGAINWQGQGVQGNHVFDECVRILTEVDHLIKGLGSVA